MSPDVSPMLPGECPDLEPARETNPPSGRPAPLEIPSRIQEELGSLAEGQYPEEACGFLLGRTGLAARSIHKVLRSVNRARGDRTVEFSLPPEAVRAAEEAAEWMGLSVLGFFHSHPDRAAVPSERDEIDAWLGYEYLITAVREGRARETRAYRLDAQTFRFRETRVLTSVTRVRPARAVGSDG